MMKWATIAQGFVIFVAAKLNQSQKITYFSVIPNSRQTTYKKGWNYPSLIIHFITQKHIQLYHGFVHIPTHKKRFKHRSKCKLSSSTRSFLSCIRYYQLVVVNLHGYSQQTQRFSTAQCVVIFR